MSELKPCPFCGGEAILYTSREESYGYHCAARSVKCENGCAETRPFDTSDFDWVERKQVPLDADREAIAAWNTRAPQWQPIETYDKRASSHSYLLLLTHSGDCQIGTYNPEFGWFSKSTGRDILPTHWMPLPAPPEAAASGESKTKENENE